MSSERRSTTATLFISNIAWDFVWQRHQTLAGLFAEDGDVVFCEVPGVRRVGWRDLPRIMARLWRLRPVRKKSEPALPPRLSIARPFVLPATNRVFCRINGWLLDRWLSREPGLRGGVDVIVNYSAARTARQLIERVPHRLLVYDCTDDWLAVRGIPDFLAEDERILLGRADLTLVPSRALLERKSPLAKRIERVPHGALVERFQLPARRRTENAVRVALLYYGHLHRQHLDFELLMELARLRPEWTLTLVGPVKTPATFPPNVHLAGQQQHTSLRAFIAAADVLLLPYVINAYTRAVLPAKIFECLASGRPIVATPLPELTEGFGESIRFATDAAGFVQAVEEALAGESPESAAARTTLAQANSWQERYRQIRSLLQEVGGKKA